MERTMQNPTVALASLRTHVARHPWRAVGGAMLLGAWFAVEQPRAPRGRLARATYATVGAFAVRAVRLVATRIVFDAARSWLSEPARV